MTKHNLVQTPANKAKSEKAREKALGALELRKAGVTYEKIAVATGYANAGSAKRGIDRLILRQRTDTSSELILMDLARLDEYQMRATNALRQNGDLNQIERLLRIQDQRYKLLGVGDETMRELREAYGVTAAVDNSTSVMIVQTSQTSEESFIRKMMEAVQINPETNTDAANYLQARKVLEIESPKNKIAKKTAAVSATASKKVGGKTKKKIVRKKAQAPTLLTDPLESTYTALSEADIIDAEIV